MNQKEMLYDQNSILIVVVVFALILIANELGYRYARRYRERVHEGLKSQTHAIQAAMLGLLALLLGFSFTMALQRFDSRAQAVIDEANAIGTAFLRADLLPGAESERARMLFSQYVDLRVRASSVDLTQTSVRREMADLTAKAHVELWRTAMQAADADPRPVTSGLFVQALNEVIDTYGKRQAALQKHVPEIVLLLLFVVFIIAGSVLGYSSGLDGRRPFMAMTSMAGLIVLVIFIVIDLDRPRRGLIQVSQHSLLDVQASIHE